MERLTKWNDKTEGAELISWNEEEWKDFMGSLDVPICTELSIAIDKLAEYEDIEEKITKKFAGCIDMKNILDSFCSFYDMQETNEELAQCTLLTNEDVLKYRQWKDAEEQGLILRLPCKVGDVLWCTDNKKTESFIVKEFKICAYKINRVEIYFENASGFGLCLFDGTLDEGWFLTKEEAEQALARMEKENG